MESRGKKDMKECLGLGEMIRVREGMNEWPGNRREQCKETGGEEKRKCVKDSG